MASLIITAAWMAVTSTGLRCAGRPVPRTENTNPVVSGYLQTVV